MQLHTTRSTSGPTTRWMNELSGSSLRADNVMLLEKEDIQLKKRRRNDFSSGDVSTTCCPYRLPQATLSHRRKYYKLRGLSRPRVRALAPLSRPSPSSCQHVSLSHRSRSHWPLTGPSMPPCIWPKQMQNPLDVQQIRYRVNDSLTTIDRSRSGFITPTHTTRATLVLGST
jgi:hypothetical protein